MFERSMKKDEVRGAQLEITGTEDGGVSAVAIIV
jgi:hypothetical protein